MTKRRDDKTNSMLELARANLSRRTVLAGGLAAAGSSLIGLPAAFAQAKDDLSGTTLVFTSWGGSYQDGQKVSFCDPFSEKTGATVLQAGPMNNAKFRTMVESGSPEWNVVDVTVEFLRQGVEDNLFEKLDLSRIHTDRLDPKYVDEHGIACIAWSYNIGYNTDTFEEGKHPKSWADVFDLEAFPGTRALRDRVAPMLEVALMADGVPLDKIYEVMATAKGIDQAFAKLDTIKDQTIFWETNSQSQQLLVDGEASMGVILNGRVFDAANKGGAVALEWNQNIQSVDYFVIPRGAGEIEASHRLIDEMTLPEHQAKFANLLAYSPTNPKAFDSIKPEITPWLATNPDNAKQGIMIDSGFWQNNLNELTERWQEWKLS